MEPGEPALVPARRLRRAAAFATDLLLLAVVGYAFGFAFFDVVTRWGPYGRAFGLILMTGYFGLGASPLMTGRTLGKRVWGLEVAKLGGGHLALAPALGRASLVSLPYLANGWSAKIVVLTPALAWGLSFIVFGIGGAILYLFLFNRTTGQALHDLAFATVVVKGGAAVPKRQPPLPRIHRVALVCIAGVLVMGSMAGSLMKGWFEQALAPHAAFWTTLNSDPRFFSVSVNHNTFSQGARTTTTVSVQAWLKDWSADNKAVTTELAARTLEHYSSAEPDNVRIVLTRAYDLGVASWQVNNVDVGTTEEWKERTATPNVAGSSPGFAGGLKQFDSSGKVPLLGQPTVAHSEHYVGPGVASVPQPLAGGCCGSVVVSIGPL